MTVVGQSVPRVDGLEKVTGRKTEAGPFLAYLESKYSHLLGM